MGVVVLIAMAGYVVCVVLVSWLLSSESILDPPLDATMTRGAKLLAIAFGPITIALAVLCMVVLLPSVLHRHYKHR